MFSEEQYTTLALDSIQKGHSQSDVWPNVNQRISEYRARIHIERILLIDTLKALCYTK